MDITSLRLKVVGKRKPRTQMYHAITHDGRILDREYDVERACALTPLKDRGFLLSDDNLFRDKQRVSWQTIDENSAIPLALRKAVKIEDFQGSVNKLWVINREEAERQNYREAKENSAFNKIFYLAVVALFAVAVPVAIAYWRAWKP